MGKIINKKLSMFFSAILVLLMIFSSTSVYATSVEQSFATEDFIYEGNTVMGFSDKGQEKLQTNPDSLVILPLVGDQGQNINAVGNTTFYRSDIRRLQIPEGYTSIGSLAFAFSTSLSEVSIPSGLSEFGLQCFNHCNISTLNLAEGIKNFGPNTFSNNNLSSLHLPDSLLEVSDHCFENNHISKLRMGPNIKKISHLAFRENELTDVNIPDSVEIIEWNAFSANKISRLTLGQNVKEILKEAFADNQIVSAVLPDSLVSLYADAFKGNPGDPEKDNKVLLSTRDGLNPNHLPSQGNYYIDYDWGDSDFIAENGKLTGLTENGKKKVENRKALIIPKTINGIELVEVGKSAFKGLSANSISMPSTIRIIGESAFENVQLKALTLPASLEEIGKAAFKNCRIPALPDTLDPLSSISFPNSLKYIGEEAFLGNLFEKLHFGENVERIDAQAFADNRLKAGSVAVDNYKKKMEENIASDAFVRNSDENIMPEYYMVDKAQMEAAAAEAEAFIKEWEKQSEQLDTTKLSRLKKLILEVGNFDWYHYGEPQSSADKFEKEIRDILKELRSGLPGQEKKVTLTFDSNGGKGTMNAVEVDQNSTYALPANEFNAPDNKEFKGWSLTPDGAIVNVIEMDQDKTVYAIWQEKIAATKTISITFVLNGGVWADGSNTIKTYKGLKVGDKIILPTTKPIKEGFEFIKWIGSEYQPGDEFLITDEIYKAGGHVLTAVWREKTQTTQSTIDNEKSKQTQGPSQTIKSTDKTKKTSISKESVMPKTGETAIYVVLGGALLSVSTILFAAKKIKVRKSKII